MRSRLVALVQRRALPGLQRLLMPFDRRADRRPPGPESSRRGSSPGGGGDRRPGLRRFLRGWRIWALVAFLLVINCVLVPMLLPTSPTRTEVPYTFFKEQVAAGNVSEIVARGDEIRGRFDQTVLDPQAPSSRAPASISRFVTYVPVFVDNEELDQLLTDNGVEVAVEPADDSQSLLLTLFMSFGPVLLIIAGFLWLSNRMAQRSGNDVLGLGRTRARRYVGAPSAEKVTFDDVAGIDEVRSELVEIVDFLKQPRKYQRLGGTIPKGVLLLGPPGTGKTLLARAVAGEAGVQFLSLSGSEFIEMVVGVGAARVRDLFAEAKKSAPAIIFVDELDAVGRRRGSGNVTGSHDEREQTLNQLLTEMDGFDAREAVIVLAATNRADVLDPALLRPGRFDRRVTVQPPDKHGRAAILKVHTRGVPLAPNVDLDAIAAQTPGLVGADLRNLVNEAALLAARRERDAVAAEDFVDALEKIALGNERRMTLVPEERRRVAVHESGHALLGLLQPESDPVRRVTVVPRGQALGVTLSVPEADRYNYSEPYLRARIVNALGGRAAEEVIYGSVTTGAEDDLKHVTDIAQAMVTRWGMSPEVGLLSLDGSSANNGLRQNYSLESARSSSDMLAQRRDRATRRIIDECYARAIELLTLHRWRLEALAEALLREESLDEVHMRAVTGLDRHDDADRSGAESEVAQQR